MNTILRPALLEVRPLLALTVPIVAGFACSTLIMVVDTVMIAPLGTGPLAAASLAGSALILFYSALYGLLTASGIRISEKLGANASRDVRGSLRAGLVLAAVGGTAGAGAMALLFAALPVLGIPPLVVGVLGPYWMLMAVTLLPWSVSIVLIGALNAEGRPWLGFVVGAAQLAANVPLNWTLIYTAGLGLLGAGVASLLSTLVSIPLAMWLLNRITRSRSSTPGPLAPEIALQWRAGWPMAVSFTAEGGGYAVAGLMLGALGAAALAANQIVQSVMAVLYMLPLGLASATSLQVGFARGEGATARLRPVLLAAIVIVAVWMALFILLLVLGGEAIARLLTDDAEVIALATTLFLVLALMQVFDGVQSASMGGLRGLLDTRWPMAVTLTGYWVVALPAAWALGFPGGMGATGVWLGYTIGVALAALALPWRYWAKTRRG
ncbi:MAG: MATE family efflux transporter [Roseinatronobacter sp.]